MSSNFSLESKRLTANEAKPFDPSKEIPQKFSTKGISFTSVSGNTGSNGFVPGTELAKNTLSTKKQKASSQLNYDPTQMC